MQCRFCGDEISPERAEIYRHCSNRYCVLMWKRERLERYRLDLVPKQGFAISFRDDENAKTIGRSSGRI